MNRYTWILFDSTGTLMTPDPEPAKVYQSVGARLGGQQSLERVRENLKSAMVRHFFGDAINRATNETFERRRWQRIVADALPDIPNEYCDDVFDSLWSHFACSDTWRLYDDVLPTIQRLVSKGYSIAIASNFDSRLRRVLQGMGIIQHFHSIFISSDLGWSKPNTRFYDAVAQRLSVEDRSQLLMIGDTKQGDVDAAMQAGLDARLLVRHSDDALSMLTSDL